MAQGNCDGFIRMASQWRFGRLSERLCLAVAATLLALAATLTGCATQQVVYSDARPYTERAETKSAGGFTVTAAALGREESIEVFGAPLNDIGIQPVWLRIANENSRPQWLFPIAIDENYFPPYEAARRMASLSALPESELFERLNAAVFPRLIPSGEVVSGFVYTHSDEGMKAFNVELHSRTEVHNFHFVVPVPGLPTNYFDPDTSHVYEPHRKADLSREELRRWLEDLICCTVNHEGAFGDPLNIVFVGSLNQVRGSLISTHWDVTAPATSASIWRMFTSFVFGARYRYAPISALYLFGRGHDLAFQKARAVIDERNHMRLWLAPVTVEGLPIWVGQVSRDIGVKLSGRVWPPTTHVIDPDMDDARFYVLQQLIDSGVVSHFGYVRALPPALVAVPHRNAEDDPYFTDGLRAVFFLSDIQVLATDIELLNWHRPPVLARELTR